MSKKQSNQRYLDDNDEDDEDYESRKARRKEAQPRFIKNRVDHLDAGEIVVNLSSTPAHIKKLTTIL